MKTVNIEEIADQAQRAATAVIDSAMEDYTNKADGPCGDKLADKLFVTIRRSLEEMFYGDDCPAFIKPE